MKNINLELSTKILINEAEKKWLIVEVLDEKTSFISVSNWKKIEYIKQATKTSLDTYSSVLIAKNKLTTKKLLKKNNINTPDYKEFFDIESAYSYFDNIKYKKIVIKPAYTNFWEWISILKNKIDLATYKRAIDIAFKYSNTIIIEDFFKWKEYRFFVLDNKVHAITQTIAANILWDWVNTIKNLVDIKNKDKRRSWVNSIFKQIKLWIEELTTLQNNWFNIDYIPKNGEIVFLRNNSNISTWWEDKNVTDKISIFYKNIAIKASKSIWINISWIDMMINKKWDYTILELNHNPAIYWHHFPYHWEWINLANKILEKLGF